MIIKFVEKLYYENEKAPGTGAFSLHSVRRYAKIKHEKVLHITAGGMPTLPEGGESDANYFDVPYFWTGIYHQGEKRKPPPCTVTVF